MSHNQIASFFSAAQLFLQRRRQLLIFGTLYFVLSIFAMAHFLSSSHLGDRYRLSTFETMMNHTASKPFVYRVLMPQLTQAIVDVTPISVRKPINKSVHRWLMSAESVPLRTFFPWLTAVYFKSDVYPRLVMTVLIYAALWGYIIMLHKLAAALMPHNTAMHWFAPILGIFAVSSFSWPWQYTYDLPVLFLSAACFYLIFTQKIKAYLVFFVLACLNRETSIFILLFFALYNYSRMPRNPFILLCMVQVILYALIKIGLNEIFIGNVGPMLEFNLERILSKDLFAQTGHYKILIFCLYVFLFTYRWQEKPAFLKCGLFILPCMYVGYLLHGNPFEYRVFFDIKPLMVLLACHTLVSAAGITHAPFAKGEN